MYLGWFVVVSSVVPSIVLLETKETLEKEGKLLGQFDVNVILS